MRSWRLFGDGVFFQVAVEVLVESESARKVPSSDQWVAQASGIRIGALWLRGLSKKDFPYGVPVREAWLPSCEMRPTAVQVPRRTGSVAVAAEREDLSNVRPKRTPRPAAPKHLPLRGSVATTAKLSREKLKASEPPLGGRPPRDREGPVPSYPASSSLSENTDPDMPEAQVEEERPQGRVIVSDSSSGDEVLYTAPIVEAPQVAAPIVVDLEDDAELEPADRSAASGSFWMHDDNKPQDHLRRRADRFGIAHVWSRLCKLRAQCGADLDIPERLSEERVQKHLESATWDDLRCLEAAVHEFDQIVAKAKGHEELDEPLRRAGERRDPVAPPPEVDDLDFDGVPPEAPPASSDLGVAEELQRRPSRDPWGPLTAAQMSCEASLSNAIRDNLGAVDSSVVVALGAQRDALKQRLVSARKRELGGSEAAPVRRELEEVERLNARLVERGCPGQITVQQCRVVHAVVVRSDAGRFDVSLRSEGRWMAKRVHDRRVSCGVYRRLVSAVYIRHLNVGRRDLSGAAADGDEADEQVGMRLFSRGEGDRTMLIGLPRPPTLPRGRPDTEGLPKQKMSRKYGDVQKGTRKEKRKAARKQGRRKKTKKAKTPKEETTEPPWRAESRGWSEEWQSSGRGWASGDSRAEWSQSTKRRRVEPQWTAEEWQASSGSSAAIPRWTGRSRSTAGEDATSGRTRASGSGAFRSPIAHAWAMVVGVVGSAYATHRAKMMFDAVVEEAEMQMNGLIQDGGAAIRRVVQTIGGLCTAFVWIVAVLFAMRIGAFIWTSGSIKRG